MRIHSQEVHQLSEISKQPVNEQASESLGWINFRLASPDSPHASWYGYAAFVLALPYPVLRICWAFGGMVGITSPGAAGSGFFVKLKLRII